MLNLRGSDMKKPRLDCQINKTFDDRERGGYLCVLRCSTKLREHTGKEYAALGSIFGFRKVKHHLLCC